MCASKMKRYRIKIEEIGNKKFKHIFNLCIDTDKIEKVTAFIEFFFYKENSDAINRLLIHINSRNKTFIDKIITEYEEDIIDWKSKGKDISRREFLMNEIFFEMKG